MSRSVATMCTILLGPLGCDPTPTQAEPQPTRAAIEDEPRDDPSMATATEPDADARREDLETMCAAVEHDYVDGTLTDYFAGVEPATKWGKELRARGDVSTTPGRVLEAAAKELGYAPPADEHSACGRLLDVLDDLE